MAIQSIPYVLLLGLFWGSTLVVSRFSVGQFQPTTYIGLRLTMAGLAHAAIYAFSARRKWPTDRRLWRHATLLGVLGTAVPMTTIISALKYQSTGITSLLLTTGPAMTVLLAHFFLDDEKVTRLKTVGVILALGGAGLLAARGESGLSDVGRASPIGYGLVAIGILSSSSMAIFARRRMSNMDAFDVASIRMFVAALVVMPLSILFIGFDLGDYALQSKVLLFQLLRAQKERGDHVLAPGLQGKGLVKGGDPVDFHGRRPQLPGEAVNVDLVVPGLSYIHHIQGDYQVGLQFDELDGKVEVSLQV